MSFPVFHLHASAVTLDDGGALFLGHSTAGKSTIARRLSAVCPHLADDTVLAWRDERGIWRVRDGKHRNGEMAALDPLQVPSARLRACFRIHKGADIRSEPLEPIELARCLMDAVMEVDVQRKCGRLDTKDSTIAPAAIAEARSTRGQWFHWAAEIARICPGHRLWFPREADPAALRELISI